MKAQRLRVRYRLTADGLQMRHRDIVEAWQSAARAAGLPVAYSQGKRPAPQISLAAPLPQGVTSDWEYVDLYLDSIVDPEEALRRISPHLPAGIEAVNVREIGVSAPSIQAALRWAEYEVEAPRGEHTDADVRRRIECLLGAQSLPAEHRRESKVRVYDLRPLILDLRVIESTAASLRLWMRLRAESENAARADQVVLALGLAEPARIHRLRLSLDDVPAVLQAFRRAGEREE